MIRKSTGTELINRFNPVIKWLHKMYITILPFSLKPSQFSLNIYLWDLCKLLSNPKNKII